MKSDSLEYSKRRSFASYELPVFADPRDVRLSKPSEVLKWTLENLLWKPWYADGGLRADAFTRQV